MKKSTLAKILACLLVVTTVFCYFASAAFAAGDGDTTGDVVTATDAQTPTATDDAATATDDAATATDDAATATDADTTATDAEATATEAEEATATEAEATATEAEEATATEAEATATEAEEATATDAEATATDSEATATDSGKDEDEDNFLVKLFKKIIDFFKSIFEKLGIHC